MNTGTRWIVCALAIVAMLWPVRATSAGTGFAESGDRATHTLLAVLYDGAGAWRECNVAGCRSATSDWGVDAQTYALALRWKTTGDPAVPPVLAALARRAPRYLAACVTASRCPAWSDTPSWDAVALIREYEATGMPAALDGAKAAVRYVARSTAFYGGACPSIIYQRPHTGTNNVKSLETEANLIKAEMLVYRATGETSYLHDARQRYDAARAAYRDPAVALYTVHVIDDGTHCVATAHRFFASVNGDMIWNGLALAGATGATRYGDEARATAHAVDDRLADDRGVFVDAGGENDVVEPLVEAMLELARQPAGAFARAWIVRNASAALSARADDGTFARFFDGPAQGRTSAWQGNGGLALQIAAAALAPGEPVARDDAWTRAGIAAPDVVSLPATISFTGSGIALVGTLSAECERHHVRVILDGTETFDRSGLWKNGSMPGADHPSVVFAWRWRTSGPHTLALVPQSDDARNVRLQVETVP
jgi:hypothetical protein